MAKVDLTDYEKIAYWMIHESDEPIGEITHILGNVFPTKEKLREEYDTVWKYHLESENYPELWKLED